MSTTTDTIVELPLEQLHDSPTNPRQHYPESYLQELANNIRHVGRVLQPLLVRPRVPALFAGADDPNAIAGYEIVFGHCRRRGAELAGLASAPCMVRAMSDEEVLIAQVSENLQRKDVHPFEEAQGYRTLLDTTQHTADDLAEQFGKSRTYIYGRLKLLEAIPEVRQACVAGKFGAEVALLIARLRVPKLQHKALGYIAGKYISLEDGGRKSYRQIQDLLNERFTLDLASAPFPLEDEGLLLSAGHCMRCPKRSGNAPEFEDVATGKKEHAYSQKHYGANVCTDPDCFAAKKAAHFKRQADALRAKGVEVVDGNKARAAIGANGTVKGAYIPLKEAKAELDTARRAAQLNGKIPMPGVVTIQDPRTGKTVQAVKASELAAAGVKTKPEDQRKRDGYQAQQEREAKARAAKAQRAKDNTLVHFALLQRLRTAMAAQPRSAFDLGLAAAAALQGVGYEDKPLLAKLWGCRDFDQLQKQVGGYSVADLTQLLMDCALVDDAKVSDWQPDKQPERLMLAAKHYGIDVNQVRAELAAEGLVPLPPAAHGKGGAKPAARPAGAKKKAAPTPSTAAQATKGAAAGKPGPAKAAPAAAARAPGAADLFGQKEQTDEAGSAGQEQTVDAGVAAGGRTTTAEAVH